MISDIWRRKKKLSPAPESKSWLPAGVRPLAESSDAEIMAELDRFPFILMSRMEQISSASAVWLGTMHDSPAWEELRAYTLKEIRAIDAFTSEHIDDIHAGIEFYYALLYHVLLWNNTLETLESWQVCLKAGVDARAAMMPSMPPSKDDRGYA